MDQLYKFNDWLKAHDLSNWLSASFSLIVWPIVILFWKNRSYPSIRNLHINPRIAGGFIPGGQCRYLCFDFQNNTGQVIYIANTVIRTASGLKGHVGADRDLVTKNYSLKFAAPGKEVFDNFQITIDTGSKVHTGLPLSSMYTPDETYTLVEEIRNYKREWWRPWWSAKYFELRFDATVGREYKRIKYMY